MQNEKKSDVDESKTTLFQQAYQLRHEGKEEEARQLYDKILTTDPFNVNILYNRGLLAQDAKEACNYYERALQIESQAPDILLYYAGALYRLKDSQRALFFCKKALQTPISDPIIYSRLLSTLGTIQYDLGQKATAMHSYQLALKAAQTDSDKADILHNIGYLQTALGLKVAAIKSYEAALRIKPENE